MKKLAGGVIALIAGVWVQAFTVDVAYARSAEVAVEASPQANQDRDQERAERDRRRATERDAREARENKEAIDDARDEIDAIAIALASVRHDDQFLQDYVTEVGQSLVPSETPAGILFSFRVIRDRAPNALALPDGRIYVTTGLLTFINNEAQLAFVLGHEIGHVLEQHFAKSIRERRTRTAIGAVVGAGLGAIIGGIADGGKGAASGGLVGAAAGYAVAQITMNSYGRQQEDEADRRGAMLALDRRFDPKESAALFQKLADTFGDQDRFANALWGRHSRNVERVESVDRLLGGDLAERYNALRSAGELTLGSAQMHLFTSAMVRDVAIEHMEMDDRYDLAKVLLEGISTYRPRDPRTLWALGKVYKTVGRTTADRNKALELLQEAVRLDERNRYPFVRRDYGLMQARVGNTAGAVESLRSYILNYQELHIAEPQDLEKMYDYLLTFGDGTWKAPKIDTRIVRAEAPPPVTPSAPPPAAVTPAPGPTRTLVPRTPPQTPARPVTRP